MKVKHLIPNEKNAAWVQRILLIEKNAGNGSFNLPLFANGTPTLLFQTGPGFIDDQPAAKLILFGQTILPRTLNLSPPFTLIAYFLKPFVITPLFGLEAASLTDNPLDLRLWSASAAGELEDKLLYAMLPEERLALIDDFLFRLMSRAGASCVRTRYACHRIACDPSGKSLAAVQKALYITERSFQRLFWQQVGIPPGRYRRICQFHAAFNHLNAGRFGKLSDIAFTHHYADQSHYIRSFREFTRITPEAYLNYGNLSA